MELHSGCAGAGFANPVGFGYDAHLVMRPDILNPLFAEVEALKGIGPGLAKPLKRLSLERVLDVLFHLPVNWIERKRVDRLDIADAGRIVTVEVTPTDYRQSGGRGPFRVLAADRAGTMLTLTYFNNPGWARKQLPSARPKSSPAGSTLMGSSCRWSTRIMCFRPRRRPTCPSGSRSILCPRG
jgi:hypothetical protein